MTDGFRTRIVQEERDAHAPAGSGPASADGEMDLLLARIRQAFDVAAVLVGIAGRVPGSPRDAGPGWNHEAGLRICGTAAIALPSSSALGILILADHRPRRMSAAETQRLDLFAGEVALLIATLRNADALADLRVRVAVQERLIVEQAAALAHSRKIFERSSEAARIGVWECALPDQSLTWTDGVYDIFDIPRGSPVVRGEALACYTPASRAQLESARSRAIAERSGFHLDAEIVTKLGRRRWIRLTATVECEDGVAVRIFGMKQDITEEKTLADRTRYLAEFDAMTGLANRTQFQTRFGAMAEAGAGALLLVDLDGFKLVNDTYGHAAGDECLRETALRLREACAGAEFVARIGGDEFAVILGAGSDAEALAGSIVEALRRPIERDRRIFRIGASVGIAWAGGCTPSELFTRADAALYAAKAAGRNTFRAFGSAQCRGGPAVRLDLAQTLPNRHPAASAP